MTQIQAIEDMECVLGQRIKIIGKHLRKACESNDLALRLEQKGFASDALQQHQLTKIFLNNALFYVKQCRDRETGLSSHKEPSCAESSAVSLKKTSCHF